MLVIFMMLQTCVIQTPLVVALDSGMSGVCAWSHVCALGCISFGGSHVVLNDTLFTMYHDSGLGNGMLILLAGILPS